MSLKCSGSGTADTCLTGSDKSGTMPLCGSAAQTGTTVGACGKCQKTVADGAGDGDAMSQGTCTETGDMCLASGECKCQKDNTGGGDGDGKQTGTCTTAGTCCCSNGQCTALATICPTCTTGCSDAANTGGC